MHAERTPNPNSIKWVLGRELTAQPGGVGFSDPVGADMSPLAGRLFEVEGVLGVFLGADFVTVSKDPDFEWTELAPPIVAGIKDWATAGDDALGPAWAPPDSREETEVLTRIRDILEREVRPYVERDGGEIALAGFSDGVVQVHLRGACAGCPSSSVTLKLAIEGRLKEEIDEVKSVIAI